MHDDVIRAFRRVYIDKRMTNVFELIATNNGALAGILGRRLFFVWILGFFVLLFGACDQSVTHDTLYPPLCHQKSFPFIVYILPGYNII